MIIEEKGKRFEIPDSEPVEERPFITVIPKNPGDTRSLETILVEALERRAPGLLSIFYPRKYSDLGGYHSPKGIGAMLASSVMDIFAVGIENSPTAYRVLYPALKMLIDKRMPFLFLAPNLLEAIKRSDFEDEIDWTELKLPYEAGIFVLPRGSLSHPVSGDVTAIIYGRVLAGDYDPPVRILSGNRSLRPAKVQNDSFFLIALCSDRDDPIWYDATFSVSRRRTVKIRDLFYQERPDNPKKTIYDEDLDEADAGFLEEVGAIAFGTLMALQVRPELLTPEELERRIPAKKKRPATEFWTPNIIGKDYVIKGRPQGGTHASPRAHWRRGHFRNQACGTGRLDHRRIWLEPRFIGAG